jgi:hypothetical protein
VKTPKALIALAALAAACGAEPGDVHAGNSSASATGSPGPAAAWVGAYAGRMTLTYGGFTYSSPVEIAVESPGPGVVRVPVRDLCPSVAHVDLAPPEALLIALAEPGAWSFSLPRGEKVRLGSIHVRFIDDRKTLEITLTGEVDGEELHWSFVGTR